jgi:hypothetical protein
VAVEAPPPEVLGLLAGRIVRVLDWEPRMREVAHRHPRRRRTVKARLRRDHHRAVFLKLDCAVIHPLAISVVVVVVRHVTSITVIEPRRVECRRLRSERHVRARAHLHRLTVDHVRPTERREHVWMVDIVGRLVLRERRAVGILILADVGERVAANHAVVRRAHGRQTVGRTRQTVGSRRWCRPIAAA